MLFSDLVFGITTKGSARDADSYVVAAALDGPGGALDPGFTLISTNGGVLT